MTKTSPYGGPCRCLQFLTLAGQQTSTGSSPQWELEPVMELITALNPPNGDLQPQCYFLCAAAAILSPTLPSISPQNESQNEYHHLRAMSLTFMSSLTLFNENCQIHTKKRRVLTPSFNVMNMNIWSLLFLLFLDSHLSSSARCWHLYFQRINFKISFVVSFEKQVSTDCRHQIFNRTLVSAKLQC